jgi:hypothetical protein
MNATIQMTKGRKRKDPVVVVNVHMLLDIIMDVLQLRSKRIETELRDMFIQV